MGSGLAYGQRGSGFTLHLPKLLRAQKPRIRSFKMILGHLSLPAFPFIILGSFPNSLQSKEQAYVNCSVIL